MAIRDILMSSAGSANGPVTYVDDVFNTYTWTGNGTYVPITTGIDLATKGGATLSKPRNTTGGFSFIDTLRGAGQQLNTDNTGASYNNNYLVTAFSTTGFTSLGDNFNYVTHTFREAPKFFDVVTYTSTGAGNTIPHNLGSAPGMVIAKRIDSTSGWAVWHRGSGGANDITGLSLNLTGAATIPSFGGINGFTSTFFTPAWVANTDFSGSDVSGATYVAYLFASNAGGFGTTGIDNIITCGTYTGNGSATGPVVTLGYEPQFVMAKASSATGNWVMEDTQRGMSQLSSNALYANTSGVETAINPGIIPTATGFTLGTTTADLNASGVTYIYMAIRMPNKPPTSGSEVFEAVSYTGGTDQYAVTTTTVKSPDVFWAKWRSGSPGNSSHNIWDKLRGVTVRLFSNLTNTENTAPITSFNMNGVTLPIQYANSVDTTYVGWFLKRAPKFFDIVCYTGTGVIGTKAHNLTIAPELMIFKCRTDVRNWSVYAASQGNTKFAYFNLSNAFDFPAGLWNSTTPTATVFSVDDNLLVNAAGNTYVAYLFATLAGVSKVGSYTGNGTSQTINCGFTGGARFVMIKRTDSTGDWYVWDTTRGIVSGTDPFLLLNTTDGEVNTDDSIDPDSTGFIVNQVAATNINVTSATYIFLAIA